MDKEFKQEIEECIECFELIKNNPGLTNPETEEKIQKGLKKFAEIYRGLWY